VCVCACCNVKDMLEIAVVLLLLLLLLLFVVVVVMLDRSSARDGDLSPPRRRCVR